MSESFCASGRSAHLGSPPMSSYFVSSGTGVRSNFHTVLPLFLSSAVMKLGLPGPKFRKQRLRYSASDEA